MNWKPIVVGVDGSEESTQAASFGAMLAAKTGGSCRLVNAVPDYWTAMPPELGLDTGVLDQQAIGHSRRLVELALADLPAELASNLDCRIGDAPQVLGAAARRMGASVVVMGAKQHRGLGRLAGSAIHHLVRLGSTPVLAHTGRVAPITRVLAAVDLTGSAESTIATAALWARAMHAQLRIIHVIEPVPVVPGVELAVADELLYRSMCRKAEHQLWPLIERHGGGELVLRRGRSAAGIVTEARAWDASLVVTTSHGKDWMHRMVIGSTSERLLHVLQTPMLVLPAVTIEPIIEQENAFAAASGAA